MVTAEEKAIYKDIAQSLALIAEELKMIREGGIWIANQVEDR